MVSTSEEAVKEEHVLSKDIFSLSENSPLQTSYEKTEGPSEGLINWGDDKESRQEMDTLANELKPEIPKDLSDSPKRDASQQEGTTANGNWAKFDESDFGVGASRPNDPWASPEPFPQTSEREKEVLVLSLGEPLFEDDSNKQQPTTTVSPMTNGSDTTNASSTINNGFPVTDSNLKPEPEVALSAATETTFDSKVTIWEAPPPSEPKAPVRKATRVAPPPPKPQSKPEPEVVLSSTEVRFTSQGQGGAIEEERPTAAGAAATTTVDRTASPEEPKVPQRRASRAAPPPPQPPTSAATRESGAATAPPTSAGTTGAEQAAETPVAKPRRATLERRKPKDGEGQSVIAYLFGPCFSCLSRK